VQWSGSSAIKTSRYFLLVIWVNIVVLRTYKENLKPSELIVRGHALLLNCYMPFTSYERIVKLDVFRHYIAILVLLPDAFAAVMPLD